MGLSIEEYRTLLQEQGKTLPSGPCAGARMDAAEYNARLLKGNLAATSSRTQLTKHQPSNRHEGLTEPSRSGDKPTTAARRPRKQPEHDEQCALFEWARNPTVERQYPAIKLMSCSLNGVKLTRAQAGKAKAAGMLKGESDVRLPVARGSWIGLIIEMKAGKNTATQEQLDYGYEMEAEGHQFHICYTWEDARLKIEKYLQQPRMFITRTGV